jgi:hypothetical protein
MLATRRLARLGGTLLLMLGTGCAGSLGTRPRDMSAAEHIVQARSALDLAALEAAHYRPEAERTEMICRAGSARIEGMECFTTTENPTDHYREEARRLHRVASAHLRAYRSLMSDELKACHNNLAQVSDPLRVAMAEPDEVSALVSKGGKARLRGARFVIPSEGYTTRRQLDDAIRCFMAHNAFDGYGSPAAAVSPLGLPGVKTRIKAGSNGYVVDVRARNPEVAREILHRAVSPAH